MNKHIFPILIFLFTFTGCKDNSNPAGPDDNIESKVEELISKMTLDEKIGQMTQADKSRLQSSDDIKNLFLGSVLSGGGSSPQDISAVGWADMYDSYQSKALQTRLKIPIIYGIDAVHGHNNVRGAVIFPHNIGFGASRNPDLVTEAAKITALEVAGTGIDWTFAPCVAVARNERWGRTYESFGETPDLQKLLGKAAVIGFQGENFSDIGSIVACAKHYVGDGGTLDGRDQGNTILDEASLRAIHLPGYLDAIKAGVGTVMISFSSWNGLKMHANKYLINDVLKGELGFKGFVISDWGGIDQISSDFKTAVEISINAGVDMAMVPGNYRNFISTLKILVQEGKVSESRINDAVRRILRIKYLSGLFDRPYTDRSLTAQVGSQEHRDVARKAVRESLVLLKNQNRILPLTNSLQRIHVSGKSADDMGNQCGGWTISWMGSSGDITPGTTILEGIQSTAPLSTLISFSEQGAGVEGSDVAVVVIGETPYAEGNGDREDLSISIEDVNLIRSIKSKGIPVVAVLVTGRPMILTSIIDYCDAIVAAWLPGTEGAGVADVLFGKYDFKGVLPHSWPRSMTQIPINFGDSNYDPLYPYGYGLKYSE